MASEKEQVDVTGSEPATSSLGQLDDKQKDDALLFTAEHHVDTLTPEEDKRLLRKIDTYLLPLVSS